MSPPGPALNRSRAIAINSIKEHLDGTWDGNAEGWEAIIDSLRVAQRESRANADLLAAAEFVVNDTPEPGEDAQLTIEGYNRLCAAIANAKGSQREVSPAPPAVPASAAPKHPDPSVQDLIDAARTILGNVLDSGSYGPPANEAGDFDYPQDADGDYWWQDFWQLKQALAAIETELAREQSRRRRPDATSEDPVDAGVMAAAPTLLAALERLIEWEHSMGGFDSPRWDEAREAIARAKG